MWPGPISAAIAGRAVCKYKKKGVRARLGAFLSCGALFLFLPSVGASVVGAGVGPRPPKRPFSPLRVLDMASCSRDEALPLPRTVSVCAIYARERSETADWSVAKPVTTLGAIVS